MNKRTIVRLALLSSLAMLAGCGGGSGGLLSNSGTGNCSPASFSLNFPAVGGFSTSGQINSANGCFSSATVTTNASTGPIGSAFSNSDPSTQVVLYLALTFSANEYAKGLPALTITLPAGVTTTGRQFYVAGNGSDGLALGWIPSLEGPATAHGTTLTFGSGGGNTTFDANQAEVMAIYSVTAP